MICWMQVVTISKSLAQLFWNLVGTLPGPCPTRCCCRGFHGYHSDSVAMATVRGNGKIP